MGPGRERHGAYSGPCWYCGNESTLSMHDVMMVQGIMHMFTPSIKLRIYSVLSTHYQVETLFHLHVFYMHIHYGDRQCQ